MPTRFIMRATAGALLLGFALVLCAQSNPAKQDVLVANASDSMFMTHAAVDGMAEIQMGQMALQKASDPKVKQLAQRIVDDHNDANAKLRLLAQDKQVTLPTAPPKEAQDAATTMTGMDGAKFDQSWTAAMVSDHRKAVSLFTQQIEKTNDPQVRAFAQATLPVLKTHLEMAQQLQGQLK